MELQARHSVEHDRQRRLDQWMHCKIKYLENLDLWKSLLLAVLVSPLLLCIDLFAGLNVSEPSVKECVHGWSSISRDASDSYIFLCLNFVNSPLDIKRAAL